MRIVNIRSVINNVWYKCCRWKTSLVYLRCGISETGTQETGKQVNVSGWGSAVGTNADTYVKNLIMEMKYGIVGNNMKNKLMLMWNEIWRF